MRRILAAAALALAALAPLVGPAAGPGAADRPTVARLSRELAAGAPLVDAVELARLIRARSPIRVVDVRDSSAFIRFSVPTAENRTLPELRHAIEAGDAVVLYDDGDGAAVRAWLMLRRLGHGHDRVRVLRGGVVSWVEDVLDPVLPNGTAEERARFAEVAELSRYFGGVPRVGRREPAGAAGLGGGQDRTEEAIELISRRGCY